MSLLFIIVIYYNEIKWRCFVKKIGLILSNFILISVLIINISCNSIGGYRSFKITTPAMEPTYSTGDVVLADMNAYKKNEIEFSDIVVFNPPNSPKEIYIKRCIGLPGDTLQFIDKKLWINGKKIDESEYVQFTSEKIFPYDDEMPDPYELSKTKYGISNDGHRPFIPFRDNSAKLIVPKTEYFLVGDNRDNSLDSRMIGFVNRKSILGKVVSTKEE